MASVCSSHAASFHYASDPHDQLTQSSRASYGFNSPFCYPDARLRVELIHLPVATFVTCDIRHAHHLFVELRLMTPARP
jgi:hypothetical protein